MKYNDRHHSSKQNEFILEVIEKIKKSAVLRNGIEVVGIHRRPLVDVIAEIKARLKNYNMED